MPYFSAIPQPGDAKSVSQGQILANFTYLNDLVLGVNNFIILPEQAAAPATTATQMALYTKHVGAGPAMFLRNHTSGTEVDFTTATLADPGWCRLPCGAKMAWGKISITSGNTYNFAVAFAAIPFSVQLTAISTGTKKVMLSAYNVTNASFKATSYNANSNFDNVDAYYIAIGI